MRHARVENDEERELIENVYMPAAKKHIQGYTGMSDEQIEAAEDISLAFLALCCHFIDNRGAYTDGKDIDRVLSCILDKYACNLL